MRLSERPIRPAIDVIEGKWKPILVNALKLAPLRFGQLQRHPPEATRKVLTEQLREMEEDQLFLGELSDIPGRALNTNSPFTDELWFPS